MSRKQKIKFVFSRRYLHLGSTTMRAHQLRDIGNKYLDYKYHFSITNLPTAKKPFMQWLWLKQQNPGVVYIVTKSAIKHMGLELRQELKKINSLLCYDYVDLNLKKLVCKDVDVHLAASYSAERAMREIIREKNIRKMSSDGSVMRLLHNVDSRLYQMQFYHSKFFNCVYFGTETEAVLGTRVREMVDVVDGSTSRSFQKNCKKLRYYNTHYCVRSTPLACHARVHKPFTKGFVASVCGANAIVNRDADDALDFLPDKYPFFARSAHEDDIIDVLELAKRTFGKQEWKKARAMMDSIAERVAPAEIARQLDAIIMFLTR